MLRLCSLQHDYSHLHIRNIRMTGLCPELITCPLDPNSVHKTVHYKRKTIDKTVPRENAKTTALFYQFICLELSKICLKTSSKASIIIGNNSIQLSSLPTLFNRPNSNPPHTHTIKYEWKSKFPSIFIKLALSRAKTFTFILQSYMQGR